MVTLRARLLPWRISGRLFADFRAFAGASGLHATALIAAGAVLEGAGLLLLVPVLAMVTSGPDADGPFTRWLGTHGAASPTGLLVLLIGSFVAVMVVRALTLHARDLALARLQTGYVEVQRNRVMRALAGARWEQIVKLQHARINNLMSAEIQRLGSSVQYLIHGSVALAMLVIQGALALSLAPGLAGLVLLLLLGGGGVLLFGQRGSRDLGVEVVQSSQALIGSAAGFLSGLKTATAQNAQQSFVAEFESIQGELRSRQLLFSIRQANARLVYGIASAMLGAVVVVVGLTVLNMAPAILITVVVILARMSGPGMVAQQAAQNFMFGVGSFEVIEALLADLGTGRHREGTGESIPFGPIRLDTVTFVHDSGGGVRNASLTIDKGDFIGLAGPSGAGKTTLIDLLVGLLHPQAGEVYVGSLRIDPATAPDWQGCIAYVAQDGFLFHDTLRRNLTWDKGTTDDAAIHAALAVAGASDLIARLPAGLNTLLGERGALLSGGERQRIGIARALLRNSDLLILDEATNALDPASERAVLNAIAAMNPRPIIIMITHRTDCLALCTRVVQVDGGVVAEIGMGASAAG